jgi:hydrogenase expression/formation protein HypC
MCLSIYGKLTGVEGDIGVVEIGGVERKVGLQLVPGASPGDYVLVHAGFAIQVVGEEEAKSTMALLSEIFEAEESN